MSSRGCADSTCTNSPCSTCLPVCYSAQTLCRNSQAAIDYGELTWPTEFKSGQIIY
jgi:hypothetical protein